MLRHGIPKQAVKQKLLMENIPITLLDYSESDMVPDTMKQDLPRHDNINLQLKTNTYRKR